LYRNREEERARQNRRRGTGNVRRRGQDSVGGGEGQKARGGEG